jgi:hypothetical protein
MMAPQESYRKVIAASAAAANAKVDDSGEGHAAAYGLTHVSLSGRNVSRLLPGIPDSLLASVSVEHCGFPRLESAARKEAATRKRKDAIHYIAGRKGWMDHGHLYFKGGEPHSVVGHPYSLDADDLRHILWIADTWSLRVHISGLSDYFPGWTCKVEIYRPEPQTATTDRVIVNRQLSECR